MTDPQQSVTQLHSSISSHELAGVAAPQVHVRSAVDALVKIHAERPEILSERFSGFVLRQRAMFQVARYHAPKEFSSVDDIDAFFDTSSAGTKDPSFLQVLISTLPASVVLTEPLLGPPAILWSLVHFTRSGWVTHYSDRDKRSESFNEFVRILPQIGINPELFLAVSKRVFERNPDHLSLRPVLDVYRAVRDRKSHAEIDALLTNVELKHRKVAETAPPDMHLPSPQQRQMREILDTIAAFMKVNPRLRSASNFYCLNSLYHYVGSSLVSCEPEISGIEWFDRQSQGLLQRRFLVRLLDMIAPEEMADNPVFGPKVLLFYVANLTAPYFILHALKSDADGAHFGRCLQVLGQRWGYDAGQLTRAIRGCWEIFGTSDIDKILRNYQLQTELGSILQDHIPPAALIKVQKKHKLDPANLKLQVNFSPEGTSAGQASNWVGKWFGGEIDGWQTVKKYFYIYLDSPVGVVVTWEGRPMWVLSCVARSNDELLIQQIQGATALVYSEEFEPENPNSPNVANASIRESPPEIALYGKMICLDVATLIAKKLGFTKVSIHSAANQRWVHRFQEPDAGIGFYDKLMAQRAYDDFCSKNGFELNEEGNWVVTPGSKYSMSHFIRLEQLVEEYRAVDDTPQ